MRERSCCSASLPAFGAVRVLGFHVSNRCAASWPCGLQECPVFQLALPQAPAVPQNHQKSSSGPFMGLAASEESLINGLFAQVRSERRDTTRRGWWTGCTHHGQGLSSICPLTSVSFYFGRPPCILSSQESVSSQIQCLGVPQMNSLSQ